jgi:hypothetical protein
MPPGLSYWRYRRLLLIRADVALAGLRSSHSPVVKHAVRASQSFQCCGNLKVCYTKREEREASICHKSGRLPPDSNSPKDPSP